MIDTPLIEWEQETPTCPGQTRADADNHQMVPLGFTHDPACTTTWRCTYDGRTLREGPDWNQGMRQALSTLIHTAVGAASVCWEDMSGTGVFQEQRARQIAQDVIEAIEARYEVKGEL